MNFFCNQSLVFLNCASQQNGRFETQTKICLSISNHHPEHWQPSWSGNFSIVMFKKLDLCFISLSLTRFFAVRTALVALIAFMPTSPNGALGSLDYTKEERRALAVKSCKAAPKYGSPERQKLIDEVCYILLSVGSIRVNSVILFISNGELFRSDSRVYA